MKKYTTMMESVPPEITPNHLKLLDLKKAIQDKNISGVKRALESEVDVDDLSLKPHSLMLATEYYVEEIFDLILNQVKNINAIINEYGENLLFPIARQGRLNCVKKLVNKGINVDHINNKGNNIILYLSDKDSYSSIISYLGNIKKELITFENPNTGMTPIVNACYEGKEDIIKLLIKLGAKLDFQNPKVTTPLIATLGNTARGFELLLDEGADPNIPDSTGLYPIFRIINIWADKMMEVLLSYKTADSNVRNIDGDTPLLVLVKLNRYAPDLFQMLIEYGANPEIEDKNGKTVWDIAEENDRDRYLKILFHADMIRSREYHNPLK